MCRHYNICITVIGIIHDIQRCPIFADNRIPGSFSRFCLIKPEELILLSVWFCFQCKSWISTGISSRFCKYHSRCMQRLQIIIDSFIFCETELLILTAIVIMLHCSCSCRCADSLYIYILPGSAPTDVIDFSIFRHCRYTSFICRFKMPVLECIAFCQWII